MSNKITFEDWLANFWKGIRQALSWVGRAFNPKYKTPFWRVIWVVITVCIVMVTCMLTYSFHREFLSDKYVRNGWNHGYNLGNRFRYVDHGSGKSLILDKNSEKAVLSKLDWIARPTEGDSILVFSKSKKRGYFNYYTGEIIVPAIYEAAWVFNKGIAAVCLNDTVFFIDSSGKPANDLRIKRDPRQSYCYHGEYMALRENGKVGLLDRKGEWRIMPMYDFLDHEPRDMWVAGLNGKVGLLDSKAQQLLPIEFKNINVTPDDGIIVAYNDFSKKRFDYDGAIIDDFIFDTYSYMEYPIDEYDEEGQRKMRPAKLLKYQNYINGDSRYGLIDEKGRIITLPLYSSIDAISADLYEARVADDEVALLLDAKGEKVN